MSKFKEFELPIRVEENISLQDFLCNSIGDRQCRGIDCDSCVVYEGNWDTLTTKEKIEVTTLIINAMTFRKEE